MGTTIVGPSLRWKWRQRGTVLAVRALDIGFHASPVTSVTLVREGAMGNMDIVEIKAFVPTRDFGRSKQFYADFGFTIAWSDDMLAYLHHGSASFLLQNFYEPEHANNFMMHILVADVEAWWAHVQAQRLAERYGVMAQPPEDRPWGLRDFVIADPTGVLWRIGQNIPPRKA